MMLPAVSVVFKLCLAAHFVSSVWNIVADCDETFNYWEPLHFLVHGSGFQTWELSPQYAVRSYFYTLLHAPVPYILALFQVSKIQQFMMLRCCLAGVMAATEAYLYSALVRRFRSTAVPILTLGFSALSSGVFAASTAFLPSSFAMYGAYVMLAAWLNRNYKLAVLSVAVAAIVGWPFAAVFGIPLVMDMLMVQRRAVHLVIYTCIAGVSVTLPLVLVDSYLYGRVTIPPLNILIYNVFSLTSGGSQLYGVEPASYYLKNYLLHFNIVSPLAALFFVVTGLRISVSRFQKTSAAATMIGSLRLAEVFLYTSPFLIWNVIFFSQAHKEERFLYPSYPFMCLAAGVSLHQLTKWLIRVTRIRHAAQFLVVCLFVLASFARIGSTVAGYHSHLTVYARLEEAHFNSSQKTANVCVGKEWYRFPSSFFLPGEWRLRFLRSKFRGQLPAEYSRKVAHPSRIVHSHFNDANQEEMSRYVKLEECDYIIDTESRDSGSVDPEEPKYSTFSDQWTVLVSLQFIDADRSPKLTRTFYIPWIYENRNKFMDFVILKRKD